MSLTHQDLLERYADLILKTGLNVQSGQTLLINSAGDSPDLVHFIRLLTQRAYQAGVLFVDSLWTDPHLDLIRLESVPDEALDEVAAWKLARGMGIVENGGAIVGINAHDPNFYAGQDPARLTRLNQAQAAHLEPFSAARGRADVAWLGVAYPTQAWAAMVFPDLPEQAQVPALWDAMFRIMRLYEDDPIAAWDGHIANLVTRKGSLDAKRYQALHFSAPGTDLTVGLADGHQWAGGQAMSRSGHPFTPNLPTEEVFTLPHCKRVEGTVTATMPLSLRGTLVEGLKITFEMGRVAAISADSGQEMIARLIATDVGAAQLGEVALVPHSSPISQSGRLFYNTLYDENAAVHIALGRGYKLSIQGGDTMDDETFTAAGGNLSTIHTDFMIGSAEMDIDGITSANQREALMRSGEWV